MVVPLQSRTQQHHSSREKIQAFRRTYILKVGLNYTSDVNTIWFEYRASYHMTDDDPHVWQHFSSSLESPLKRENSNKAIDSTYT
jgi:hypothetical protein